MLTKGMDMELVLVPFRTDDDGNEVVTFAFQPVGRRCRLHRHEQEEDSQMDVAVVGVGLHPFGRFAGVSGIEMGAIATRRALADAGVEWRDIQFAFGGSYEVDNPDAVVALLGLTGIPFTDVYNGCATAASVPMLAATRSASAITTSASPSAWTSTYPGCSVPIRARTRVRHGTESSDSS